MSRSAPISGRWARRCTRCLAASSSRSRDDQRAAHPDRHQAGGIRLRVLCPHLHESVARIVDRALAYERKDRWPNAREFQQAVRQAIPFAPAGPTLTRPRQPSGAHADATMVASAAAISAITNRSETLTTGRPLSREVGSFAFRANAARLADRGSAARFSGGCGDLGATPAWSDDRNPTPRQSVGTRSADSHSSGDRPRGRQRARGPRSANRHTDCGARRQRPPRHQVIQTAATQTRRQTTGNHAPSTSRSPPPTTPIRPPPRTPAIRSIRRH